MRSQAWDKLRVGKPLTPPHFLADVDDALNRANLDRKRTKDKKSTKQQLLSLVTELLESLGGLVVDLGALLGLGKLAGGELLALVVGGTLGLAALLETKQ